MSEGNLEAEIAETSQILRDQAKSQEEQQEKHSAEKSTTKSDHNSIKKYLYGFATLFVLVLLIIIFYPRRPPRSPYLPIPYVWDKNYLEQLKHFTGFNGHSNVLIVTGPEGIGKASGLYHFAEKTNKTFQTPLILDCEIISETATVHDIANTLIGFLVKGFQAIDGRPINLTILSKSMPILKSINLPPHPLVTNITDQNLLKIANYAASLLSQIDSTPASSVFTFMEIIDQTTDFLNTFVFMIQPSKLVNLKDRKARLAAEGLISFLNNFRQGMYKLPVVVTDSNLLSANAKTTFKDLTWFKIFHVGEFEYMAGRKILVNQERVFPKKLYHNLYQKFGGFGQLYVAVHDLIREKVQLPDIIKLIESRYTLIIAKAVHKEANGDQQIINIRYKFLQQLARHGIVFITPSNADLVNHFIAHGIIKLTPNMIAVQPINLVMKAVINQAISYAKK